MPGMLFSKSSGQSGVLLGTSRPSGPADLPFSLGSPKCACRNWSGKRSRCLGATLPMIASVLGSIASEHRFRCSEALLPMVGCPHTEHCFQKAVGNGMDQPGRLHPKNRALIPWDVTESCEPTHDTATQIGAREIGEFVLGGYHHHRK